MTDRVEHAVAGAANDDDAEVLPSLVETRQRDSSESAPLYSIEDRRYEGDWRVVAETYDIHEARRISGLLKWAGCADVRITTIPQPIIV